MSIRRDVGSVESPSALKTSKKLALLLLLLLSSLIAALPASSSTALAAKAYSHNLTSLAPLTLPKGYPLGYPFRCEIVYDYESPQISPIALYLNVIDTVYYLSALDQRRKWPLSSRSLAEYDLEVGFGPAPWMPQEPLLMQIRVVLMTLQCLGIEVGADKVWKPVAGVALWHGEVVGMVSVQPKVSSVPAERAEGQDEDRDAGVTLPRKAGDMGSSNNSRVAATGKLKVSYQFNESAGPLKSIDVFTLTINTFVHAAQHGLDSRCEIFTEWSAYLGLTKINIKAHKDIYGNVQLRYGHARTAMKRIVDIMVAERKFITMQIMLSVDDVEIATGYVYQAKPESLAMQVGDSSSAV